MTGGSGTRLVEENGRELIDMSGAWGAASLGYGHPAIVEAVNRTVASPPGASILSTSNEPAVALAERPLQSYPGNQKIIKSGSVTLVQMRTKLSTGRSPKQPDGPASLPSSVHITVAPSVRWPFLDTLSKRMRPRLTD